MGRVQVRGQRWGLGGIEQTPAHASMTFGHHPSASAPDWPEPGGFLPHEILYLLSAVAKEGICGMEVVEVSPPYDQSEITALPATRAIVDVLGTLVAYGKLGSHRSIIRGWSA